MNTKLALLLFAALAVVASAFDREGDVLVLTDADLDEAIKAHDFLLVEFYAPWCGHCKSLAPEYAKAATTVSGLGLSVALAKVDATEEREGASRFGVNGYPTLKWFVNGKDSDYSGGRTAADIVQWIKKKTGPACKPLADSAAVEAFKSGADVTVVAFLAADSDEFKAYESAARASEDIEFGFVTDESVASGFGAAFPSIVLFKTFDEGKNVFDAAFTPEAIGSFVTSNSIPLISTFSQETAPKIFGSGVETHFLYFNSESSDSHEANLASLREVAGDFKGKTLFVYVPATEDRVMSYFDFTAQDLPKAILVSLGSGDMKKFGFDKEITADNVRAHVAAFHSGELKPTLKSEAEPEDNSDPVTVLVGTNFARIALDETKDVLVEFYAPWCGHCKSLTPTYEKLGKKFADKDSIVIAKIDATANDIDHPGVNVRGFPTILFFPANAKSSPITYEGARELDDFVSFIEEHATTLGGDSDAPAKKHTHDHVDL